MKFIVRALVLVLCFWSAPAFSHDLEVDLVSFFPTTDGNHVVGQVIFDPELTRKTDEVVDLDVAEKRVLAFVTEQLSIHIDDELCKPQLELRELFERGGAGGDSVHFDCPIHTSHRPHELSIKVGPHFSALMITGPALDESGRQSSVSELVQPGTSSPVYRFFEPAHEPKTPALAASGLSKTETKKPAKVSLRPWYEVVFSYVRTGFLHILPLGADHVLFVIGVVLGATTLRHVAIQLTGFTIAHSMTLALVALGVFHANPAWVEPLIALSIALLGVENLVQRSWTLRYRLPLIFLFGLVHGLGFAGALADTAPQIGSFLYALLGFNLGVELGQLVVASLVFFGLWLLKSRPELRMHFVRFGSGALVMMGLYWGVSRIFS